MNVKVRVYATLRRYLPDVPVGRSVVIELPGQATLGTALDRLGIPRAETKLCFVNGRQRDLDHCLHEADELALFPPIAGGDRPPVADQEHL